MSSSLGLSVKKLLSEYFSVEDLKDALYNIGESTYGTKDELVNRLASTWKLHNHDNYELLDYLDEEYLLIICTHYNLDDTPANESALKRRIRKARLLDSNSTKKVKVQKDHSPTKEPEVKPFRDVNINIGHLHLSKGSKIGIIVGIIGTAATIIGIILSR